MYHEPVGLSSVQAGQLHTGPVAAISVEGGGGAGAGAAAEAERRRVSC